MEILSSIDLVTGRARVIFRNAHLKSPVNSVWRLLILARATWKHLLVIKIILELSNL